MRRIAWAPLLALIAVHSVFGQSPEPSTEAGFRDAVAPLVKKHCVTCHGKKKPEGDVSLVGMTSEPKTAAELAIWRNVFDKLARREMPPPDSEQPSDAERRRAARWIAATLKAAGVAVSVDLPRCAKLSDTANSCGRRAIDWADKQRRNSC